MASQFIPGTRALRVFVAAGKYLNFSKAADEISLTPAAVSYQIKEMEEQLGFALFRRSSRSIQLTPEGEIMYQAVSDSLEKMTLALGQAKTQSRKKTQLKLSVGARFATYWLLPKLDEFRKIRPDLSIVLDISDDIRDLARDDFDMAIRFGQGNDAGLESRKLFETTLIPVCSPQFLKTHPAIDKPEDLFGVPLSEVYCWIGGIPWPGWKAWMSQAGVAGFQQGQSVSFPDLSHVIQTVQEHVAVGLVESVFVGRELAQGSMVQLFETRLTLPEGLAYYFVFPHQTQKRNAIEDFLNWLCGIVEEQ
ncbi:hypothetical protein KY46_16295 [Photobacterium halotolerans]|uniref:HTH lysR-type domain-containing protein n=2 Tax=Photobacterium halotolerans TaxID=265726 RepID=A0A0F5V9V8_9GAMM|nr:hypothetical protein KY46_16295 [Photobacterium halotolerans]